jgi:hypothetical protein
MKRVLTPVQALARTAAKKGARLAADVEGVVRLFVHRRAH